MKSTPAALVAHIAGRATSIATLFKLTRTDGEVFGLTDHDTDIVYSGVTYKAAIGVDVSSIQTRSQLNVDNLEAKGFLSFLGITERDIAAGVWDYCDVRMYRVNWADLTMGDEKLPRGWLGNVTHGRGEFTSEIRSLTQKLQSRIVEIVSNSCGADLFDERCKVVATEGVYKFSGLTVTSIVAAQRQFTCSAITKPEDFFTSGRVVWTSGDNTGLQKEIKKHSASGSPPVGGTLSLQETMPYVISVGDAFTLYAGCTKRFTEDCAGKFDNAENFRGYPSVPGNDSALQGP